MRALTGLLLFGPAAAGAAIEPCDVSGTLLQTFRESDILICGGSLPEKIDVGGLEDHGIELRYQQALTRCDVHDKRPGLHLVLHANKPARSVRLVVTDAGSGAPVCELKLDIEATAPESVPAWIDAMPDDSARFIDISGIRTRYFERGSGPPLVLVHGGQAGGDNNSAQKWEQNFDALAEHFRVIALDRLGQAGTGNPPNEHYADYFAHDAAHLQAFVDALELDDLVLVGHSQGGWPVTRVALNDPERIRCLVNVDTVMVPDDPALMREALASLMYMSRHLHPPGGPTFYSARRGMRMRYPSGNHISDAKAKRVVGQHALPKTRAAAAQMKAQRMTPLHPSFQALKQQAFGEIAAGGLEVRSLVIWGAADPQVPPGLGRQLDRLLRDAGVETKLIMIPGAGHAPFIEFPEAFNRAVIDYCGSIE